MRSLLPGRHSSRSATSATPTSPPPPSSPSRSRPLAVAFLPKLPLDSPLDLVVEAASRTTGLVGLGLSGRGPPMVAFSAAPLKQCPPFPTSPQVQDPTLDMAMIQTGVPPYKQWLLVWLVRKEELREEAEFVRASLHGWNKNIGVRLKKGKLQKCVHSNPLVFVFCLGLPKGVSFLFG